MKADGSDYAKNETDSQEIIEQGEGSQQLLIIDKPVKQQPPIYNQAVACESQELVPAIIDVQALLTRGIENGLTVETLERLLSVRKDLKSEYAKEAFFTDFAKFQSECPVIVKNKTVKGAFSYDYASLDCIVSQVQNVITKHGFSYIVKTKQDQTGVTAITEVHHRGGHTESTEFSIPIDIGGRMNASQKVGSALTYAKRYSFCNAFGIMTMDDDDDGNSTSEKVSYDKSNYNNFASGKIQKKEPIQLKVDMDRVETVINKMCLNSSQEKVIRDKIGKLESNPKLLNEYINTLELKSNEKLLDAKASNKESEELTRKIIIIDSLLSSMEIDKRGQWIDEKDRCKTLEDYDRLMKLMQAGPPKENLPPPPPPQQMKRGEKKPTTPTVKNQVYTDTNQTEFEIYG